MVVRAYNGEKNILRRGERLSTKGIDLSTSLYQLLYCCKRKEGQNIDFSSHCQIKFLSRPKTVCFWFCSFFFRQLFVRSKTNFPFCMFVFI
jgi:hypothetical protein